MVIRPTLKKHKDDIILTLSLSPKVISNIIPNVHTIIYMQWNSNPLNLQLYCLFAVKSIWRKDSYMENSFEVYVMYGY